MSGPDEAWNKLRAFVSDTDNRTDWSRPIVTPLKTQLTMNCHALPGCLTLVSFDDLYDAAGISNDPASVGGENTGGSLQQFLF